jgi:triosephosphate isomerase
MGKIRRPLVAGNWKMKGLKASLDEIDGFVARAEAAGWPAADIAICPPATLVGAAVQRVGRSPVTVGGQDCHPKPSGAHTGDISAEMLADLGARWVIVGHSERRADHHETDVEVAAKAAAAHRAGLAAIVCLGETQAEREAGQALDVVARQVAASVPAGADAANTVIAYEPVWAIGSGLTPTLDDIAAVHAHLRARLADALGAPVAGAMRILYGGSVKPANAAAILALDDVDGALVGGASLKAADFWGIASAVPAAG